MQGDASRPAEPRNAPRLSGTLYRALGLGTDPELTPTLRAGR